MSVSSEFTTDPPAHPNQPFPKKLKKPTNADTAAGSTKGEPPILPAGSYTATPAVVPQKSRHNQILEYEMALAAKHQALDECSALIDSAVEELQVMSDASDRFWTDVRQLKDGRGGKGRWAVVPKPDYTRVMGEGEKAKDVMIPYAVDEGEATESRCGWWADEQRRHRSEPDAWQPLTWIRLRRIPSPLAFAVITVCE